MQIQPDWDLQPLNTLAVPARAEFFCAAQTEPELLEALEWVRQRHMPLHLLGGGSNLVLAPRLPGLTLQVGLRGKTLLEETEESVLLRVSAGESWHQLVVWCLAQGYYGLENLALIPGTVGAAPVQNIGAYGVEISRFVAEVETLGRNDGARLVLSNRNCEFSYRDSLFKQQLRNRQVITSVTLRLSRRPQLETSYPALREALSGEITPQSVFDAVCRIRREKLPDPALIPNCGSFFKNPIVPMSLYEALHQRHPDIPSYSAGSVSRSSSEPERKLAAAWLIDRAGWKGREYKGTRVHGHQALVLTNPNRLPAGAVLELAHEIQQSVRTCFGVTLELEPELLGF
jgi:UDP-N-acetylmuramate dehydrogenase